MSRNTIFITKARVSYPHLFRQPIIKGDLGKCGATLLLEPGHPAIAKIEAEIAAIQRERWDGMKLPPSRLCMRSGEERMKPEYGDAMGVSCNVKSGAALVLAGDGRTPITSETESRIYAGCYVNAKIALWGQDNDHGKRVNAELVAIQFAADGPPLDDNFIPPAEAAQGFGAVEPADALDF